MINAAGYGTIVSIRASNTFPNPIAITQFADDADPLDVASISVSEAAMGLNGDLVVWSKANPIKLTLNVLAGGEDDANLAILLDANRVSVNKLSSRDVISLFVAYPNENSAQYVNGIISEGTPGQGVASSGRQKTKAYTFIFEDKQ